MWMAGYKDGGEFNMPADSFLGRKLRPLIPRPMTSNSSASPTTNPSLDIFHGADHFFSQYHNMSVTEQGKMRDQHQLNNQPVAMSSSRWNPTPEQLSALEELYHRGTRTPSAEQIQHITAQLRRFGKIEGKNVFYWFQNHKARERQKRRRQLESSADQGINQRDNLDNITDNKDSTGGGNRTMFEEQNKNSWVPPAVSRSREQESFSTRRTEKTDVAECRSDGWIQFDEGELQQRRNFAERNATLQIMQLSCPRRRHPPPPPPPSVPANHHFINTPALAAATSCSSSLTITTTTVRTERTMMDPKLIKPEHEQEHELSFFKAPHRDNNGVIRINCFNNITDQDNCVESQTLQLFPLRSEETTENKDSNSSSTETSASAALMNPNFNGNPSQFYEFLPLKN